MNAAPLTPAELDPPTAADLECPDDLSYFEARDAWEAAGKAMTKAVAAVPEPERAAVRASLDTRLREPWRRDLILPPGVFRALDRYVAAAARMESLAR